jgi:hypothetical protein
MANDIFKGVLELRAQAWGAVIASPDFAAFKALDDAVVALGGATLIVGNAAAAPRTASPRPHVTVSGRGDGAVAGEFRKISQTNAAAAALKGVGNPLSANFLMEEARSFGAVVGGEKPLVNFTSSLSKDDRFYSFRKEGNYYWWLTNEPLPPGWKETGSDDFDLLDPVSDSSSQEGGDAHAATTAN